MLGDGDLVFVFDDQSVYLRRWRYIWVEHRVDKGDRLAVYTYGTPNTTPSQGFLLGAGVSLNAATGRGPWSGLFNSTTGAYGPVNGGFFESPPGGEDPGYFGLEIGAGPGLPGVGSTTTNYTPVLQLTHPAPNGCTKGH
jgi:hypothetical protein